MIGRKLREVSGIETETKKALLPLDRPRVTMPFSERGSSIEIDEHSSGYKITNLGLFCK